MRRIFSDIRQSLRILQNDTTADSEQATRDGLHCPHCHTAILAEANFCHQCGTGLSGMTGQYMAAPLAPGTWVAVGDFRVCVHELDDRFVAKPAIPRPLRHIAPEQLPPALRERAVCLNVEYANESHHLLNYRPSQWHLYDYEGYRYQCVYNIYLYGDNAQRRLEGGSLGPRRRVRGWIAFSMADHATLDYVQFVTTHGRGAHVVDITLREAADEQASGA
jgi:hypothetical protein